MKKLLVALMAFGTLSAFAGTLINNRTNEELVFNLNEETRVVTISGSLSTKIDLKLIKLQKHVARYYGMSEWFVDEETPILMTLGTGIAVTGVADTLAAPVIAIDSSLKNKKFKNTHRLLMSVISSNQELKVKNKVFNRVFDYLLKVDQQNLEKRSSSK